MIRHKMFIFQALYHVSLCFASVVTVLIHYCNHMCAKFFTWICFKSFWHCFIESYHSNRCSLWDVLPFLCWYPCWVPLHFLPRSTMLGRPFRNLLGQNKGSRMMADDHPQRAERLIADWMGTPGGLWRPPSDARAETNQHSIRFKSYMLTSKRSFLGATFTGIYVVSQCTPIKILWTINNTNIHTYGITLKEMPLGMALYHLCPNIL